MRRTITVKRAEDTCSLSFPVDIYYRGNFVGAPLHDIIDEFNIKASKKYKYVVTIVPDKNGQYMFKKNISYLEIYKNGGYLSLICAEEFLKLFKIKTNKRYNITVKKVLKKK